MKKVLKISYANSILSTLSFIFLLEGIPLIIGGALSHNDKAFKILGGIGGGFGLLGIIVCIATAILSFYTLNLMDKCIGGTNIENKKKLLKIHLILGAVTLIFSMIFINIFYTRLRRWNGIEADGNIIQIRPVGNGYGYWRNPILKN